MGSAHSSMNRCDLCNFKIEDGDEVIPVGPEREYAADPLYGVPVRVHVPGTTLNSTISNAPRLHHDACARQAPEAHAKPHPASYRTFEPSLKEDGRRHRWIMRQLANHAPLPPSMPFRPRPLVARPIFREYAAAWNEYLWHGCNNFNSYAYLRQPIWIRWFEYEGQRYVRGLSNTNPEGSRLPLYTPSMEGEVDTLYFAVSYMGIVDIVCGTRADVPIVEPHPDIYWRSLEFPDKNGCIKGITDGLKLRSIVTINGNGSVSTGSAMASALPQPHGLPLRHFPVKYNSAPEWVNVFKFNEPGTTGYSFCWNQRLVDIHAHKIGENVAACYEPRRDHGPMPVWQYMPIEPGEYINLIWHHTHESCRNLYISLMTSKGRIFRLGTHVNMSGKTSTWIIVDRPRDETSYVYYTDHPSNISFLAFDGKRQHEVFYHHQGPGLPSPPFDIDYSPADFFFSGVKLNGVASVRVCKRSWVGVDVVVGLLIRFKDGHEETLGQVQLNALGEPMDATHAEEMWFRFDKVLDSYPNVVEVRLDRPPEGSEIAKGGAIHGRCWLGIDIDDYLEWWYTDISCILQWRGLRTPRIKHRDPLYSMALAVFDNSGGGMDPMFSGWDDYEDFGDLIDPHEF